MKPAALLLACVLTLCAGCHRVTRDMANQPRYNPASSSPLFADQQASRPPVAGSVAQAAGEIALVSSGRAGLVGDARPVPAPEIAAQLAQGHARYEIYCTPCHGADGRGDGEVVRRGFPAPLPFGAAALRAAPDARLHDAIRHGAGRMFAFDDRVSVSDAWAIVAYIRQLQRADVLAAVEGGQTGPVPAGFQAKKAVP